MREVAACADDIYIYIIYIYIYTYIYIYIIIIGGENKTVEFDKTLYLF